MSSTRLWDRAASVPVPAHDRPRPELAGLPPGLPSVETLFTFARDAELRFATLRMRIEERTWTARGERVTMIDAALRHPGQARVTTAEPSRGAVAGHETWISDGETVRTFSAPHRMGTQRPVRRTIAGLEDADLPGMSTVYRPLTALPRETLPDAFLHPGGLCQNVLATGRSWVSGSSEVAGREAIVLECDHPRSVKIAADRPDHHLQVSFDRETGAILRLVESIGGDTTRDATVVDFAPDATLSPETFDFTFPADATLVY
jgi:outer membrane lipoprotein-sorting protein